MQERIINYYIFYNEEGQMLVMLSERKREYKELFFPYETRVCDEFEKFTELIKEFDDRKVLLNVENEPEKIYKCVNNKLKKEDGVLEKNIIQSY